MCMLYVHYLFIVFDVLLQIFVGGLDPNVTEDELRQIFAQFGELVYVKIPLSKGCGFVQFGARYAQKCKLLVYINVILILLA